MTNPANIDDVDPDAVAADARDTFDLKAALMGRRLRTGSIVLFTDEVTGAKHRETLALIDAVHATARDEIADDDGNVILEAIPLDTETLGKLDQNRLEYEAELDQTSMSFEWRTVPKIVVDQARRKASHAYGSERDGLAGQKLRDYDAYFLAWLLHKAVTRYQVAEAGIDSPGLSWENAQALDSFLPMTEMLRFNLAYSATQFEQAIQFQATDTADFSQGI